MVSIFRIESEHMLNTVESRLINILFSAYADLPEYGVESDEEAHRYIWWLYRSDPRGMFIAKVNDEIAGFIASHSHWWDKYIGDFVGEIHEISVDRRFHGKGVGSKLMSTAEQYFVNEGRKVAGLWVGVNNVSAIRFYEKKGYIKGEIRGPWLRMRKYLAKA